jgi:hypothetical protein
MSVMIGIDPHEGSHAAAAVDTREGGSARGARSASEPAPEQRATGVGGAVPRPTMGDRVCQWPRLSDGPAAGGCGGACGGCALHPVSSGRVLDSTRSQKNHPNDARSVAIVALRQPGLPVVKTEDHVAVLRMLAKRHKQLSSLKTQAACRLHGVLATLIPGGLGKEMVPRQASALLRRVRPATMVEAERKRIAHQLLAEVRRLETELKGSRARLYEAVEASNTSLVGIYGVGPVVAGLLIGYTGDRKRRPKGGDD